MLITFWQNNKPCKAIYFNQLGLSMAGKLCYKHGRCIFGVKSE